MAQQFLSSEIRLPQSNAVNYLATRKDTSTVETIQTCLPFSLSGFPRLGVPFIASYHVFHTVPIKRLRRTLNHLRLFTTFCPSPLHDNVSSSLGSCTLISFIIYVFLTCSRLVATTKSMRGCSLLKLILAFFFLDYPSTNSQIFLLIQFKCLAHDIVLYHFRYHPAPVNSNHPFSFPFPRIPYLFLMCSRRQPTRLHTPLLSVLIFF